MILIKINSSIHHKGKKERNCNMIKKILNKGIPGVFTTKLLALPKNYKEKQ